jgi:hypothetical protein
MAHYLLEEDEGYFAPAASLGGAVLEDALRRLCAKHQVSWPPPSSIKKLNGLLRDARILTPAESREVQGWEDIRNDVDHGELKFANPGRVRGMLDDINGFLSRHLG